MTERTKRCVAAFESSLTQGATAVRRISSSSREERERVRESKWLSLVSSANSEPLTCVVRPSVKRKCASTINKGPNERASNRSPSWPERAFDWESGRTVCEIVDTLT